MYISTIPYTCRSTIGNGIATTELYAAMAQHASDTGNDNAGRLVHAWAAGR
jgi:hypothetical protein